MQTSTTQYGTKACRAGVSCHPTVTALAVLNGPLGLLDVCCLWLLGLWHEAHASVRGDSVTSHPSLAAHALLV